MDRDAIKALIETCYQARHEGRVEELMSAFHPEAIFEFAGSKSALAIAGASRGHQDIRASLTALVAIFEFIDRDILSMTIDGDRAAVRSRIIVRYIPANETATTELLDLFRVRDGKIVELVEFVDTALVKHMLSLG